MRVRFVAALVVTGAGIAAGALALAAGGSRAATDCGDHAVGKVTLTQDLLNCVGVNGLIVDGGTTATIDLNGFMIDGDGIGLENGIAVFPGAKATIKNGTIRDFQNGVWVDSAQVTLQNVELTGNAEEGLWGTSCASCKVVDSVISDTGNQGITLLAASDNLTVRGTTFARIPDDVLYYEGSGAKITGNWLLQNGERGIRVTGAGNTVSGNTISRTTYRAVVVEAGSTGTVVSKNTISGGTIGIHVMGAQDTVVAQNTVSETAEEGIKVEGSPGTAIARNTVGGGALDGIAVDAGSTGSTVSGNTSSGNGGDGFSSGTGTTVYAKNLARANTGEGFELGGAGAVDGGGNAAYGNFQGDCPLDLDCD